MQTGKGNSRFGHVVEIFDQILAAERWLTSAVHGLHFRNFVVQIDGYGRHSYGSPFKSNMPSAVVLKLLTV